LKCRSGSLSSADDRSLRDGQATPALLLTVLAGFGSEDRFIVPLLAAYPARIEDAREFAHRYRVLLLRPASGVGIDVSLGGLPFEESVVSRATLVSFGPGSDLRTCSAEDLVVLKLFASRPLDIRDAEGR
jgi:hypothetical protein